VHRNFRHLGLQAELGRLARPERFATAAGLFQTARFVGAAVAGELVGIIFANGPTTDNLHRVSTLNGLLSRALLLAAARRAIAARGAVVVAPRESWTGR
jgi:hypothetical protein